MFHRLFTASKAVDRHSVLLAAQQMCSFTKQSATYKGQLFIERWELSGFVVERVRRFDRLWRQYS